MTIEFSCTHCGKALSTSDDKAGRKAKCPGCGEAVLVPSPMSDDGYDDTDLAELPGATVEITCPMCGAKNPGAAKACESCGEPIGFKRLLARPVTTMCIVCKEEREREEVDVEPEV